MNSARRCPFTPRNRNKVPVKRTSFTFATSLASFSSSNFRLLNWELLDLDGGLRLLLMSDGPGMDWVNKGPTTSLGTSIMAWRRSDRCSRSLCFFFCSSLICSLSSETTGEVPRENDTVFLFESSPLDDDLVEDSDFAFLTFGGFWFRGLFDRDSSALSLSSVSFCIESLPPFADLMSFPNAAS